MEDVDPTTTGFGHSSEPPGTYDRTAPGSVDGAWMARRAPTVEV